MKTNREILNLAIPSIVSNITVPLLGLVDLTIVGHMGNEAYIGAIAVGTMIFNVIYWLFGFLRMGTSGMASQAFGRRDRKELGLVLQRVLLVGMAIALAFLILQVPILKGALTVIQPATEVKGLASTYFNICIWGAPAMLGLYGLTGWFIGMQNTRMPMMVAIIQNVVNIVASLTLVFGLGMKIEGVALGTLIAQWSGFGIALYAMTRLSHHKEIPLRPSRELLDAEKMRRFFSLNLDIFLRTVCLVGVNLFFTSAGARQGTLLLSVNTLLLTLYTLFSYIMDGFAYAGEALSGKYFGARDSRGFHDVCRQLAKWGAAMVVVFTASYALATDEILHLLTNQEAVIAAAQPYLHWTMLIPIAGVAAFIYDGIFIGITATRGMLLSSAIASTVFFIVFIALSPTLGNHALWLAFVLFLAFRGIVQYIYLREKKLFAEENNLI